MSTQECRHCGKPTEHGWRKLVRRTTPGTPGSDDYRDAFCCTVCGTQPTAPRDAEWAKAVSEIKELALAIRTNLQDDACPYVQDDKWVITAAAHALVILDNVEVLARHAPR